MIFEFDPERHERERAIYEILVYPGTGVLRNKFGVKTTFELNALEAFAVENRLPTRPRFENFTLVEMRVIHKHILQDVFDWAGELRQYTTARGPTSFPYPEQIESLFELHVLKPLQAEGYLKGLNREQFAKRAANFANEVNAVHPFVDGNGRITRFFLEDLSFHAGYLLDVVRIEANKGSWYDAMKQGFNHGRTHKLGKGILISLGSLNDLEAKDKPVAAWPKKNRMRMEGLFCAIRIVELAANPVQGNFDTAHLREVHRRIFQDWPHHWPGQAIPSFGAHEAFVRVVARFSSAKSLETIIKESTTLRSPEAAAPKPKTISLSALADRQAYKRVKAPPRPALTQEQQAALRDRLGEQARSAEARQRPDPDDGLSP